jgi:glycerol-3-phosphate dehydrogenase
VVAGGKYTTYRRMAQEIVDYALEVWRTDARASKVVAIPSGIRKSATLAPVNPRATAWALDRARRQAAVSAQGGSGSGSVVPEPLFDRYGAEALEVVAIDESEKMALPRLPQDPMEDPDGFPLVEAQLRYAIRTSMVIHLADFYFRRLPLFLARKDHGRPWIDRLARVWAQERGLGLKEAEAERERLVGEVEQRSSWLLELPPFSMIEASEARD